VSASVAAGMVAVRSPQALPSAMSSKRSGRLTGSPPVKTMSGVPISAVWRTTRRPASVVSSRGSRPGRANARQCRQATAQACVVSQMTRKGA
jgi:hypothetical protein